MEVFVRHVQDGDREQASRDVEAFDPERPLHHSEQPPLCRSHKFGRRNLSGTSIELVKNVKL